MKTFRALLLAASVGSVALVSQAMAVVTIGAPAPDFTLNDINGRTHKLADYRGKIVVLEWVNSGCPFVQKHYHSGNIPRLQQSATSDGVVWLAINTGRDGTQGALASGAASRWLQEQKAAPTAYLRDQDGTVGRLYGAKATPHLFVINADGVLVYNGAIDSIRSADLEDIGRATNYVSAALADLKAGRPVATAATQPYGCAVKY
ncbi:redoxin domain-containing protein [Opitutus terrae]|uniref:Alkyl hydroperoxide reductase/ Thiol specific antioxidant/ Mal allergen n=1 Tax=Opitutus terrae (strain DSM 11246 / JCM 15787 / PB90-1) TaxID=452637 RepID=B1ZZ84_OPITP|nr:redoxin domain-containing protein [Opitutus terrae]ACB77156.1 alkyl hydroperoxide reductase/ Thiol specific antioxidant/ Mal allergen [Opitutus terrae PB90-1]